MSSKKKKGITMSWQEMQQASGVSRDPLAHLPSAPRGNQGDDDGQFRLGAGRYPRREERDDNDRDALGPSRSDDSTAWRSTGPSPIASSRPGADRYPMSSSAIVNRSEEAQDWRGSSAGGARPAVVAGGASRDAPRRSGGDLIRNDLAAPAQRPKLQLQKPSAERLAAARELDEQAPKPARASPFGDAAPIDKSPERFVRAATITTTTTTEPLIERFVSRSAMAAAAAASAGRSDTNERFARPTEPSSLSSSRATPVAEVSERFQRPAASAVASSMGGGAPLRPRPAAVEVKVLAPGPVPRRSTAPSSGTSNGDSTPSSISSLRARFVDESYPAPSSPLPDMPTSEELPASHALLRSALAIALADGTSVSPDDLADSIAGVDLAADDTRAALSVVLAASLRERTVLLSSAIALLPAASSARIVELTLQRLVASTPAKDLAAILRSVDVVDALGLKALDRPSLLGALDSMGLAVLAPAEDLSAQVAARFANGDAIGEVFAMLKASSASVPGSVSRLVGEHVVRLAMAGGAFDAGLLEANKEFLQFAAAHKNQIQLLFGAQAAWFAVGKPIKRAGRSLFEALIESRVVTIDGLVAWKDDMADKTPGKRPLLLQVGGFISELQMASIARQTAADDDDNGDDSDGSVDLDGDFPEANRNYDGY